MLLRLSRATEGLDKAAGVTALVPRVKSMLPDQLLAMVAGSPSKKPGKLMRSAEWLAKHWKLPVGATVAAAVPAVGLAHGNVLAREGMGEQNFRARQMGLIGPGPPKAPVR
jgi:hypothetical protein